MRATSAGPTVSPTEPGRLRLADRPGLATGLVVVSALSMGLVPVFARELSDSGLSPVSVSFYRNLLGTIVLARLLRFDSQRRTATLWALAAGVGMGIGWAAYVRAVEVVPVSTAGVLYMSYPMFAILLAWIVFRQRPTGRALIGGAMVLVASMVALGPQLDGEHTDVLLVAFVAPISFGFAIAVLTERLAPLRAIERVAPIAFGSCGGLLPIMLLQSREAALPADGRIWLLVLGMGSVTAIGPQWLYSLAAPYIGAARAAVAGAIELPTMFIVGFVAFDEGLTLSQLAAGLIVVAAILLVPSRSSPALTMVRKRRRLIPGHFYRT